MSHKRQSLIPEDYDLSDLNGVFIAAKKGEGQSRKCDPRKYDYLLSYWDISPELHEHIADIVQEFDVSPSDVMRLFAEHGLEAFERGSLKLTLFQVPGKLTLFPGDQE